MHASKKLTLRIYRREAIRSDKMSREEGEKKTLNVMFIVSLVDGAHYHILEINLIKHHIKRHKENTFTRHSERTGSTDFS